MRCTWKNCENKQEVSQLDKNGNEWANLCKNHHEELENAIKNFCENPSQENIKNQLRCWVLASGGADAMTKRICR